MVQATFSPAVAAGLHNAMAAGLPREASVRLADAVGAYSLVLASSDFLMGVAVGVSGAGVVAIAVAAIVSHRSRLAREEQELVAALGSTSLHAATSAEVVASVPPESVQAESAPVKTKLAKPAEATHAHQATKIEEPAASAVKESGPARHASSDYGDIAQNYVSRLSWRDRMSIRARGVQAMLAERLGVDMFEDVPVIQRADGTVGDVGTGWWDFKLGDSVRRDFANLPEMDDIDMTGVRNVLVARAEMPNAERPAAKRVVQTPSVETRATVLRPTPEQYISRVAHLNLSPADRAVFITNHVPFVDEEAFPDMRAQELEGADLWALAMDAMEARGSDSAVLTGMGTAERDALHMHDTPTEVLPFRPVAGHPEVVDKATYVDYLLRQELERNSSDAVRRTGRDYLRLLDGGSSSAPTLFNIPVRDRARHSRPARHMAPSFDLPLAMEA